MPDGESIHLIKYTKSPRAESQAGEGPSIHHFAIEFYDIETYA